MDRNVVVVGLALVTCGPLMLLAAVWPVPRVAQPTGRGEERALWISMWLPFVPAALVLAALFGWALQEPPSSDEILSLPIILAALGVCCVQARALVRAVCSLMGGADQQPAATVGVLRPRVQIAPRLSGALDAEGLRAVLEHELAHVRHRDPARIWLAQLATDMLWPLPAARARFRRWQQALEIARDEEARCRGVDGAALAGAVITAARLRSDRGVASIASVTGDGRGLAERIHRLLQPLRQDGRHPSLAYPLALLAAAVILTGAIGFLFGDGLIRALPGVVT